MLIICYQAIVIPYRFSFKARAFGSFRYYELAMDVFFMFDLCKSLVINLSSFRSQLHDRLLQERLPDNEEREDSAALLENMVHYRLHCHHPLQLVCDG